MHMLYAHNSLEAKADGGLNVVAVKLVLKWGENCRRVRHFTLDLHRQYRGQSFGG